MEIGDGEDIGDPGGNRTTLYLGGVERISQSGTQTWRRHVGGVAVVNLTGATETVRWLFQDHLGSIDAVSHDNGVLAAGESMSFDAHGRRRDVEDWRDQPPNNPQQTTRGFTGHESVDGMQVIHMNGRIYDPQLGRFLQPDPVIQEPTNAQSWNAYTYVFNNPLAYNRSDGDDERAGLEQRVAGSRVGHQHHHGGCGLVLSGGGYGGRNRDRHGDRGGGRVLCWVCGYRYAEVMSQTS